MATTATSTLQNRWVRGPQKIEALYFVTLASKHSTAGDVVSFASEFPTAITDVLIGEDTGGYIVTYNRAAAGAPATGKFNVRWTTSTLDKAIFPEVTAGTDLTAVQFMCRVRGY